MKFKDDYRAELFGMARELSPLLGDVFQNPINVTSEEIDQEIQRVRRLQKLEASKFDKYLDHLGTAYCFPDQVQGIEYEQDL